MLSLALSLVRRNGSSDATAADAWHTGYQGNQRPNPLVKRVFSLLSSRVESTGCIDEWAGLVTDPPVVTVSLFTTGHMTLVSPSQVGGA